MKSNEIKIKSNNSISKNQRISKDKIKKLLEIREIFGINKKLL